MKQSIDDLKKKLVKALAFCSRYSFLIFFIIFAAMSGFLVTRIGELSRAEPSQAEIDQRLQDIKMPKVDDDAIAKLKELQGRNISIEALFDNGRTNPFEN